MFFSSQDFAGKTGTTANVEDEGWFPEGEKFKGAMRHGGLNILDAGGGGVLCGCGVIVVEVGRPVSKR